MSPTAVWLLVSIGKAIGNDASSGGEVLAETTTDAGPPPATNRPPAMR